MEGDQTQSEAASDDKQSSLANNQSGAESGNDVNGSEQGAKTQPSAERVADGTEPNEEPAPKANANLPEINRSRCDVCHKEFSSIWVLKAHKEEYHRQVVPLNVVETFADDYRKDYERRAAERAQAEANEEQSAQGEAGQRRPTPTQTPSESQLAAASASTSSTQNTATNQNTAAQINATMANAAANSAQQAPAGDMSVASQMAAQLQFSQLLMSMGLAGMGGMPMGMNAMPFAAAMGLPPQLGKLAMRVSVNHRLNHRLFSSRLIIKRIVFFPNCVLTAMMMGAQFADPVMAAQMAAAMNHPAAAAAALHPPQSGAAVPPPPQAPTDPAFFAAQQAKLLQQQQQQIAAAQQQKRARTRITDDQLKILRQYFDINNSPTEEQLQEMSEKSGLPLKVIKHWFRNTLFKERQRNKDSPYNFNNPPSTFLNLEEYEKTGEAKVIPIDESQRDLLSTETQGDKQCTSVDSGNNSASDTKKESGKKGDKKADDELVKAEESRPRQDEQAKAEKALSEQQQALALVASSQPAHRDSFDASTYGVRSFSMSPHSESSVSSISTNDAGSQQQLFPGLSGAFAGLPASALSTNAALQMAIDAHRSQVAAAAGASGSQTPVGSQGQPGNTSSAPGKRANRTRFTDYQIKVLQEFFESNAYPKDDDLEYLSKLLNLSPRVIVVWFQNARQKARKVYENQPAVSEDESPSRFQRTPGLNYQCKRCQQVFQRYYELIKHQKSACFKDSNPEPVALAAQLKAAQEARNSASPGAAHSGASNSSQEQKQRDVTTPNAAPSPSQQAGTFRCEKCSLVFPRFDLWREHQMVHFMNPNLFPNSYPPTSPFGILQQEALQQAQTNNLLANNIANNLGQNAQAAMLSLANAQQTPTGQGVKRKVVGDDDDSRDSHSGNGSQAGSTTGNNNEQQGSRDKRLRTTILPEQLDYLYQKYQIESNPSRKMLENIANEVGLKKRVVQVWFQNTRARERKGQFRAHQQVIHKRCPFCRALFKARSALESHLATRHADQYTKGDINIDALPDGDPSEDALVPMDDNKNMTPEMLQMKQYFDSSQLLKKYIEDITGGQGEASLPPELGLNLKAALDRTLGGGESAPLDLSKPVDLSRPMPFGKFGNMNDEEGFDSRSEGDSESDGEGREEGDLMINENSEYDRMMSNPNSPGPGSTTSSITSPAAVGSNGHAGRNSSGGKRYRTQMSTTQLKVMKSVFQDYKTPSMAECETLGREVGLPKRVVQVWFQNARAKEKKAKLAFAKSFGHDMPDTPAQPPEECKVCNVKYNLVSAARALDHALPHARVRLSQKFSSTSMQDHLFSKSHIENMKLHIEGQKKFDGADDSSDFAGASIATNASNDESLGNPSKSAANLMAQLQMMGLASALQGGLPNLAANELAAMNGDSPKKDKNVCGLQNYYAAATGLFPAAIQQHSTASGRDKL